MRKNTFPFLLILLVINLWSCSGEQKSTTATENSTQYQADIIVYGGTSAAITAAVPVFLAYSSY